MIDMPQHHQDVTTGLRYLTLRGPSTIGPIAQYRFAGKPGDDVSASQWRPRILPTELSHGNETAGRCVGKRVLDRMVFRWSGWRGRLSDMPALPSGSPGVACNR